MAELSVRLPPTPLRRNRDYLLLWSGQAVSSVGNGVSAVAYPFLVLAIAHSLALAGTLYAVTLLPYLLFALPAGALIDRWDRKRVMQVCDIGRALCLGSLPVAAFFGWLSVPQLLVTAFIGGTCFVFFNIAEVACLPQVVAKSQIGEATGYNQATENVAALLGPSLGGVLFSVQPLAPFAVDAVSFLASVASLFAIRTPFQGARPAEPTRNLGREIGAGLRWVWEQPLIRALAAVGAVFNFVFGGYLLLIIALILHLAGRGQAPALTGLVLGIGGGGGILGALVGARLVRRVTYGQMFQFSAWVQVACWLAQVVAPNVAVLGAITAVAFFVGPIYNIASIGARLAILPDELQGRVNSVFRLTVFSLSPLGALTMGILLTRLPVGTVVLLMAAPLLLVTVVSTLYAPIRTARQPV